MESSIVNYPVRGEYGAPSWRGNTCGEIIKDFLGHVHKTTQDIFCDPAEGSGTSRDVAREMKIRYIGLDLHSGFDLLKKDLGHTLQEPASTIFFHPPYHNMIKYSGNVWGEKGISHPSDLSSCNSLDDFLTKMQLALMNINDAIKPGGNYGVLIGNMRRKGEYIPLSDLVRAICPGRMKEEIIKVQNNCMSDKMAYMGSFVPIKHEKMYIFQKNLSFFLNCAVDLSNFLSMLHTMTWRNLIVRVFMRTHNKEMRLTEIYDYVENSEKTKSNHYWREKVRQTLQNEKYFRRISTGVYQMV